MFIIYEVRIGTEKLTEVQTMVHMDTADGDMDYAEQKAIQQVQDELEGKPPRWIAISIWHHEDKYYPNLAPSCLDLS